MSCSLPFQCGDRMGSTVRMCEEREREREARKMSVPSEGTR